MYLCNVYAPSKFARSTQAHNKEERDTQEGFYTLDICWGFFCVRSNFILLSDPWKFFLTTECFYNKTQ